jgi:hypothetical protein
VPEDAFSDGQKDVTHGVNTRILCEISGEVNLPLPNSPRKKATRRLTPEEIDDSIESVFRKNTFPARET